MFRESDQKNRRREQMEQNPVREYNIKKGYSPIEKKVRNRNNRIKK